jgi:hypothetical protein
MGRCEITFALGTADPELARIRFQEENAKLERMWHEHLNGRQYVKLSQRQISALAGEFYRETVARIGTIRASRSIGNWCSSATAKKSRSVFREDPAAESVLAVRAHERRYPSTGAKGFAIAPITMRVVRRTQILNWMPLSCFFGKQQS